MLIAHTTDLSGHDELAFVHATALAVASGARLVTIYGNAADTASSTLPDARTLAARWGRDVVHERLCHDCCDDVADTVLDALQTLRPDLVVLGTHGRHGFAALTRPSVGEAIARNLEVPVLVVPNRSRGFVDPATGAIDLGRIVISSGTAEENERGTRAAGSLLALARAHDTKLEIVDGKHDLAAARDACLIVMPSHGHEHVSEVLFGSHAEHVIRDAPCPVLVVQR